MHELETERLVVVLTPAPDPRFSGHCVRTVECRNPAWYRRLAAGFWNREGCQLRRSRVERALRRLIDGWVVRGNGYEGRILRELA